MKINAMRTQGPHFNKLGGMQTLCILLCLLFARPALAQLDLHGNFTQGGLVSGTTRPGNSVYLDNRRLQLTRAGKFVFGFGRDAQAEATLRIETPGGKRNSRTLTITKRTYQTQHVRGLQAQKVSPDPKHWSRIRKETRMVRKARAVDSANGNFVGPFIWPLYGIVTGVYGSQRILNGRSARPHYGIDVTCPTHTPVRAPAGGEVTLAENDLFFSGGTLIIDHGHGISSSFLHLEKLLVRHKDRVEQGEIIGEVGATGRATGPHLDWRVNWFEKRLDPSFLVEEMPTEDCAANRSRKEGKPPVQ